jgi:hypothetical protein
MTEANWYWAEGEKQNGPAQLATVARLVSSGKLVGTDLVWQEGMPEWVAVESVPALVKYLNPSAAVRSENAAVSVAGSAAGNLAGAGLAPAAAVGYYNPSGLLPPRAALALQLHAAPRGDVGDWPLNDDHVGQFDAAWKLRRRVLGAAALFRLLLLLTAIGDVFVVIALAAGNFGGGRASIALITAACMLLGLTALYYFTWKATVRSQIWAPLTMGILFVLVGLFNVITIGVGISQSNGPSWVGGVFTLLVAIGFAFISLRAYAAIPKYLRQPAWIQELLSKAEK